MVKIREVRGSPCIGLAFRGCRCLERVVAAVEALETERLEESSGAHGLGLPL